MKIIYTMEQNKPKRGIIVLLLCSAALNAVQVQGFPPQGEDIRYVDYPYHGSHQIAKWLVSQLSPKEIISPIELPLVSYRVPVPVQTKRNSEVTNAIIGSEETQKMYRDGRK